MNTHKTSSVKETAKVASLGEIYGYSFIDDTVDLNATFNLLGETAHNLQWTLQLRAAPAAAVSANAPGGILIAEAPLPPLAELSGTQEPFHLTAPAQIPAGRGEFSLSLALVSKQEGQNDRLHDFVAFPRSERFLAPRFAGEISSKRSNESFHVSVGAIENPRAVDNLSGTLSVELWALAKPYSGGAFQGAPLAGVIIGQLAGQQSWSSQQYDLTVTQPPAGIWHQILMLREWTAQGYITRDYHNFELPLLIALPNLTPIAKVETPIAATKPAVSSTPAATTNAPAVATTPAKKAAIPSKSRKRR